MLESSAGALPTASVAERPVALPPVCQGAQFMPHYRIYTVGSAAHFLGVQVIECADDKEAIKTARQLVDDRDVEVWKRDRFITLLPGKPLP